MLKQYAHIWATDKCGVSVEYGIIHIHTFEGKFHRFYPGEEKGQESFEIIPKGRNDPQIFAVSKTNKLTVYTVGDKDESFMLKVG
jgi:hypothetical protein